MSKYLLTATNGAADFSNGELVVHSNTLGIFTDITQCIDAVFDDLEMLATDYIANLMNLDYEDESAVEKARADYWNGDKSVLDPQASLLQNMELKIGVSYTMAEHYFSNTEDLAEENLYTITRIE